MNLQTDDLRVFEAIARLGGVSSAAREMRRSPSSVARVLERLESELDARLFHRTTRSMRLSAEGERFREHAQKILGAVDEAESAIAGRPARMRGRLRLTAPATYASRRLAPVFAEYAARHPLVELDLVLTDAVLDLARAGVDLAIRIGRSFPEDYVARRLAPDPKILCAAPSYLRRYGTPSTAADLTRHRAAVVEGTEAWPFRINGRRVIHSPRVALRTTFGDFALSAAEQGIGLARLSLWHAADSLAAGRLVRVLEHEEVDEGSVIAAIYPRQRLAPRAAAMLQHLTQALA